jgi:uncharacterized protein YpuA (DUF1002 family)
MGVPVAQVETALELNAAEATTYADLAGFTRQLLTAGEAAAPDTQKKFWTDSLIALNENVDQFAQENRDLMRLIMTMKEIDPAVREDMFNKL